MNAPPKQFLLGLLAGLSLTFLIYSYVHLSYREPPHPTEFRSTSLLDSLSKKQDSHEQFDQVIARSALPEVHLDEDKHMHHDDDKEAKQLAEKIKVLVWVMTNPNNLEKKAKIVKETWGKRCNKVIFFSSETNNDFPTIGLDVPEGREHLTAKTMRGFRYVYEHHFNDADWFMKVSDVSF
ncbi:glycoprotein-N-acetylgalactosamine 3-beta-galactosyltransferase 1 [Biomphalaria glabrata]